MNTELLENIASQLEMIRYGMVWGTVMFVAAVFAILKALYKDKN